MNTQTKFYVFELQSTSEGVIESDILDATLARDDLITRIGYAYGPDMNIKVTTFREATEDEVAETKAALAEEKSPQSNTIN